jgi:hypothetical protein
MRTKKTLPPFDMTSSDGVDICRSSLPSYCRRQTHPGNLGTEQRLHYFGVECGVQSGLELEATDEIIGDVFVASGEIEFFDE